MDELIFDCLLELAKEQMLEQNTSNNRLATDNMYRKTAYTLSKELAAKLLAKGVQPPAVTKPVEDMAKEYQAQRGTGYNNIPSLIRECFAAGCNAYKQSHLYNKE